MYVMHPHIGFAVLRAAYCHTAAHRAIQTPRPRVLSPTLSSSLRIGPRLNKRLSDPMGEDLMILSQVFESGLVAIPLN